MTRVAVAYDHYGGWHEGFLQALAAEQLAAELVELDHHDWIERVTPFDAVLWKSSVMGAEAAAHFKEKIYFLETELGKLVFPSFRTVWHFESKIAQSYLFAKHGVPTPKTIVSFDHDDARACIEAMPPPYVFKQSAGAGSEHVWLVEDRAQAAEHIDRTFAQQLWHAARGPAQRSKLATAMRQLRKPWLRQKLRDRLFGAETFKPVYWQELVAGSDADLRVTVIGGRYAIAFWRRNRKGDFRASGSGELDYAREVPRMAIDRAFTVARELALDTVAFDLLPRDGDFVFLEMSYGYLAGAVADAPGVYVRGDDGAIEFERGGKSPQELWVKALARKLRGVS